MSKKPQTFDEWWKINADDMLNAGAGYNASKKAYNAGQKNMAHVSGALTKIVNAMNNTEFFKSTPNMAPKLWNAIDEAKKLLR